MGLRRRLGYLLEKSLAYHRVVYINHLQKHRAQPSFFQLTKGVLKILMSRGHYLSSLRQTAAGDESMKPIIKGTEGEWVLSRYLLPPGLHEISVGDVVVMRYDPAKIVSSTNSAHPNLAPDATANVGTAMGVTATEEKKSGDVSQLVTAASFKTNNPKKLMKRKKLAQTQAATSTVTRRTDAATGAAYASSSSSSPSSSPASSPSSSSSSLAFSSSSSSSSSASQADTSQNPLKAAFRRVAAVAGDEIVSSRPSDEPFRIEKDHFWLLADNLAVPAKEAIDSRTIGPVHKSYILERALYVRALHMVRSEDEHGPIRSR
ncbi:unnamed protein product [Closterium sp. Naga37s-1]|nr:unnamed protein product [Closterium sp. Naga37s-1]